MPANFKKFDVRHGLSINGLEFVDGNRNVTLNNLTVQGTSTVVDTRTVTLTDPIIELGVSGSTLTIISVISGTPGRFEFNAEDLADIAIGDSFEYNTTGVDASPLVSGTVYYVTAKDTDLTSSTYGTITFSATQGGADITLTGNGGGTQTIVLNPLRDLGQDLGVEFNYVDGTPKKGFFGFDDSAGRFTFLLDSTYRGQSNQSDDGVPDAPDFIGTKSGVEFSYAKLEPSIALTVNQPALDIDQIWNTGGITFKAIEVDIVDTASAAASNLLDISVDGNQELLLRKDGVLSLNTSDQTGVLTLVQDSGIQSTTLNLIDGTATWNAGGSTFIGLDLSFTQTAYAAASKLLSVSASADRNFVIDAEGETIHRAEFTGGTLQTAFLIDATDTSSAADSLLLDLQTDNVSVFSVDKDGDVIANGTLTIGGSLTIDGPGNFEDTLTIQSQTNGTGNYNDTTEFQTSTSTISAGATAATTINSFTATSFTSAEVIVQVKQGSNIHTSKLLLIHDGTDVYLTEYGTVYNSDVLVTWDAIVIGGNVVIQATNTAAAAAASTITTVKTSRIAITA